MTNYQLFIFLIAFIPGLINLCIFCYTYFYLKKGRLTLTFSFLLITSAIFQFSDAFIRISENIDTAILVYRTLSFGVLFLLPSSVHFSLLYSNNFNKKRSAIITTILYLPSILFYLANLFYLNEGYLVDSELFCYTYVPLGIVDQLMSLWLGLLGFTTIFILFSYCKKIKNTDIDNYKGACLLALGFSLPASIGIITQIIMPLVFNMEELPLTTTFITFFSLASIYSINKYKLFAFSPNSISSQILSSLNEGIIITNKNGIIIYMSNSFQMIFGYTQQDLINKNKSILCADEFEFSISHFDQYEMSINDKQERIRNVLIKQSPYLNHHSKVIGTMYLLTDVSRLRENELKLIKTETKLLLSQRAAGVGFIFWDLKNNTVELSDVSKEILGVELTENISAEEFTNQVVYPEDLNRVNNQLQKAITNKEFYNIEHRLVHQKTKKIIWVKAQAELFFDEQDIPSELVGTFIDITKNKESDKESLIATLRGEENEKKRIALELHDGIAQYLVAINMNLSGIKDSIPAEIEETFSKIQAQVVQTINETRDISHNLIPKEMDNGLETVLKHIAEKYNNLNQCYIQVNTDLDDDITLPQFTKFNLYRITQEFVSNTFKYAEAENLFIKISTNNNTLYFSLSDNGIGFDITEKTKNGIGIKNMEQRTKAIDGTLTIESFKGKGTTLTIAIPLTQ